MEETIGKIILMIIFLIVAISFIVGMHKIKYPKPLFDTMNNEFHSIQEAAKAAEKWYFYNYGYNKGVYYKGDSKYGIIEFFSNERETKETFICKIKS